MLPFEIHPHPGFGFVWREHLAAAKVAVAPGPILPYVRIMSLFSPDSHSVAALHIPNCNPNPILGDLISGRPTKDITGSFSIYVTNGEDSNDIGDVLPSDLHKALYRVALVERKYGPVKFTLDPHDELFYGGASV
jgi:hypothetical protein